MVAAYKKKHLKRKNIWKGTEQWPARVNSPDSDLSLQVFKQRLNLHFSGMCESASLDRKWNEMSKMLWFQLNYWDMGLWTPLEAGKRTVRQTFCKSHINQAPPSVPFGSRLIINEFIITAVFPQGSSSQLLYSSLIHLSFSQFHPTSRHETMNAHW